MACMITKLTGCFGSIGEKSLGCASWANEKCSLEERVIFLYKGIKNLYLIPNFVAGAWVGVVGALTGGNYKGDVNQSQTTLLQSEKIVSLTYKSLLGCFLYPSVASGINDELPSYTEGLTKAIIRSADDSAYAQGIFCQHFVSRGKYVFAAVVAVVSRVVMSALGLLAAVFSLLPISQSKNAAELAFRELQFPGLVKDVLFCFTRIINPWANVRYNGEKIRDIQE